MNDTLRVVRIVEGTSVDGPGLRTSIYFAGCAHRCPQCHNEATWDFMAGNDMAVDEILKVVDYNELPVTFSGGDPLYQAERLLPLAKAIKQRGLNLWCYTGFTFEELRDGEDLAMKELLSYIDVLVDGPFIAALRNTNLLFRGSENQRLINVPATLRCGNIVEEKPDDGKL